MTQKTQSTKTNSGFRQITERYCSTVGDNVVVMQTVSDDGEFFKCMSAEGCPNSTSRKNNIKTV